MFLFVSPGSWSVEWSGMTCQPSAQTSIPGLYPPGRAFVHSADPMSQRFGHPDSQIPTPSDGSVEQVTYPLAREYVGQGRLLMRDYKCEHVTRYLSAFIYTTSFSTLFPGERGPLWTVAGNVSGSPTMLSWIGTRYCIFNGSFTSTYDLHKKVSVKAAFISEFQKETITLLKYSQKIPVTVPFIFLFKN